MRWVGLVVVLWCAVAAAETHRDTSQRRPRDPLPADEPPPDVLAKADEATAPKPDDATAPKPDDAKPVPAPQPAAAKRVAAAKKAVAVTKHVIKVEPNEFTNDPVLGYAPRVNGKEVTGLVAFTFDDGPNPETTPAVLDALKHYDIPATFFIVTKRLVGKIGEKPRELLARTMAEGHVVQSHSVNHAHLGGADAKKLDKEVDKSFVMLSTEAKRPIGMFRAPFGALGALGRARLKKLAVTEVYWSIDTRDWQATNADQLRANVLAMIVEHKGGVVLMHDVKPITAQVIAHVLDDLEAENCRRLATKQEPLWPVSIHYFVRDGNKPRAVPADVAKRTEAYKKALPARCAKRPQPVPAAAPSTPKPPPTAPASPTAPVQPPVAPAK